MDEQRPVGCIENRTQFLGVGALVQALGVVSFFFFFPFGLLLGLVMLLVGHQMAKRTVCGKCGNRVERSSKLCPVCKCALTRI